MSKRPHMLTRAAHLVMPMPEAERAPLAAGGGTRFCSEAPSGTAVLDPPRRPPRGYGTKASKQLLELLVLCTAAPPPVPALC